MSKNFEEQDGNEKHDEIAGAQSGNDCAQTGEVCSSERDARPKLKNRKQRPPKNRRVLQTPAKEEGEPTRITAARAGDN